MTGGKTLGQVRAELEAAFGTGPAGKGEVAAALRRFLANENTPASGKPRRPKKAAKRAR